MNTSTRHPATNVRAALKRNGFLSRRVTVRARRSIVHVTIRDASVSLTKVQEIALAYWSVHNGEAPGELDGNVHVLIAYAAGLIEPVKREMLAHLEPSGEDQPVPLPGGFCAEKISLARRAHCAEAVRLEGPGISPRDCFAPNVPYAVERLAAAYLDDVACRGQGRSAAQGPT